jgi:putative NADH-flavin reductase
MKICVFGANGKTGKQVVEQALQQGISVIACDLSNSNIKSSDPKLQFMQGDVLDLAYVKRAIEGCDAVISVLGVKIGNSKPIVSEGNDTIVKAMKELKVKRLITQSAFGARESWKSLPFLYKIIHKLILGPVAQDKNRMEDIVSASDLDWTIIRPIRLTNGSLTGAYKAGKHVSFGMNPHVSRADVADFILRDIADDTYIHSAVTITQ